MLMRRLYPDLRCGWRRARLVQVPPSKIRTARPIFTDAIRDLRNVGIIAHIDAGKTTTTENMLFLTGTTNTVGRVDSGDTVTDFLPQERERGITIQSAAISMEWKNHCINLIDTPGHVDFTVEVERAMRVLDGAVVVIDAVAGVQAQTQTVWSQSQKRNIPAIAFVNKMDREGASFDGAVQSLRTKLSMLAVPIQIPIGAEDKFYGVVDLISLNRIEWKTEARTSRSPVNPTIRKLELGDREWSEALQARTFLLESLAELDDSFMEKYLDSSDPLTTPTVSDILSSLRRACSGDLLVPVMCGSSLRGKGVQPLLDSILAFLPSPLDRRPERLVSNKDLEEKKLLPPDSKELCALAFKVTYDAARGPIVFARVFSGTLKERSVLMNTTKKTKERVNQLLAVSADDLEKVQSFESGSVCCIVGLHNTTTGDTLVMDKGPLHHYRLEGLDLPRSVFALSIEPEKSSQQTELEEVLRILCLEDPSLSFEVDTDSGVTMVRGIGELHLEVVCDRILTRFGIEVCTGRAYVAYREGLEVGTGIESQHVYDKTYGTKRLYARLDYTLRGGGSNEEIGIECADEVRKTLTNDEYIALTEGLKSASVRGPLGYPLVGLHVVIRAAERDGDSSPGSFQACAAALLDSCLRSSSHVLLEPIMSAEIETSASHVGDILSDFTVKRRGFVKEVVPSAKGDKSTLFGSVPLATMLGYASAARSLTQGEVSFSLEYSHHIQVDRETARKDEDEKK